MALQLHWKFDEVSGTTAADSSGNSRSGTLSGTTFASSAVTGPGGSLSGALILDGTNDYVSRSSTPFHGYTNFSFAIWCKKTTSGFTSNEPIAFSLGYFPNAGTIFFEPHEVWPGGGSGGGTAVRFDNAWYSYSDPSFDPSQWHHWAITYDGTNLRIYRDSVLKYTSGSIPGKSLSVSGWDLIVGNMFGYSRYYPGSVDDFRVYNHALTGTEVTDLFNLASSGGGTSEPITTATEKDIGISPGTVTSSPSTVATEKDTGVAIGTVTSSPITTATEKDLGVSVGTVTSSPVTTGTEKDLGVSPGAATSSPVGTATEKDVGISAGGATSASVTTATEVDLGISPGIQTSAGVSVATEKDLGVSPGTATGDSIETSTEKDLGISPGTPGTDSITTATERDVANPLGTVTTSTIQPGTEHDVASQITTVTGDSIDTATEHDIGQTLVVPPPPSAVTVAVERDKGVAVIVAPVVVPELQITTISKIRSVSLSKKRTVVLVGSK